MKANELKATDLMVGDWLMFYEKPYQVKGLHDDDTVTLTGYRSMYYLIDAEPILLTPEILEKNGFKYEKKNVVFPNRNWDEVAIEYMYCEGLRCSFDIIHGYLIFNSNTDLKEIRMIVTYVHELQHALKLCGIDKEIVV